MRLLSLEDRFLRSDSPIQSLIISGNERVIGIADMINDQSFGVKAILSPTVKEGKERIRMTIHSFNSQEEMQKLLNLVRCYLKPTLS